jgi:hypothetical protein
MYLDHVLAIRGSGSEVLRVDTSLCIAERILSLPLTVTRRLHLLEDATYQHAQQGPDDAYDDGAHLHPSSALSADDGCCQRFPYASVQRSGSPPAILGTCRARIADAAGPPS